MIIALLMTLVWDANVQFSQPDAATLPAQYAGYYRRADHPACTRGNVMRVEPDRMTWYHNEVYPIARVIPLGNQVFEVTTELDVGLWGVETIRFSPNSMSIQGEFDAQPVSFRKCPGPPEEPVSPSDEW